MSERSGRSPIKVLICDDSALVRLFLKAIIEEDSNMQVIALARNGNEAIDMARKHKPDVITMDIDMPELDGLSALRILVEEEIAPVIMISSLTEEGADQTLQALEIGAFDFLLKPQGKAYYGQSEQIINKLKTAARRRVKICQQIKQSDPEYTDIKHEECLELPVPECSSLSSFYGVAVGASTGGPKALIELVSGLPEDLNAAFFIVQHMPKAFIAPFTKRLASRTKLKCHIGQPGERIEAGMIYVADGDCHMTLSQKNHGELYIQQELEPKTLFMPSVNVMMQSVAKSFCRKSVGVILTGMGNDGAQGIKMICQSGGQTIAESRKTAVVYGMPHEAVKLGGVHVSLPLFEIPEMITRFVKCGTVAKRST